MSSLTSASLTLLKKMGEGSKHYPEFICRTDAVNFGKIGQQASKHMHNHPLTPHAPTTTGHFDSLSVCFG